MVTKQLEDIVREYMIEAGEESDNQFFKFLSFGIRAVNEFHYDMSGVPTSVTLTIDTNTQTVAIPSDCLKIISVAELRPNNTLNPLKIKDGIVLNDDPSPGYGNAWSLTVGVYFGSSSISGAGYKIDHGQDRIKVTSEVVTDELYVTYLASKAKVSGKTLVHPFYSEAILAYIRFANIRSNLSTSMNEKMYAEKLWKDELDAAKRRERGLTMQDYVDIFRSNYSGAPRT